MALYEMPAEAKVEVKSIALSPKQKFRAADQYVRFPERKMDPLYVRFELVVSPTAATRMVKLELGGVKLKDTPAVLDAKGLKKVDGGALLTLKAGMQSITVRGESPRKKGTLKVSRVAGQPLSVTGPVSRTVRKAGALALTLKPEKGGKMVKSGEKKTFIGTVAGAARCSAASLVMDVILPSNFRIIVPGKIKVRSDDQGRRCTFEKPLTLTGLGKLKGKTLRVKVRTLRPLKRVDSKEVKVTVV